MQLALLNRVVKGGRGEVQEKILMLIKLFRKNKVQVLSVIKSLSATFMLLLLLWWAEKYCAAMAPLCCQSVTAPDWFRYS